jgi:hypothetical protein
MNTRQPQRPSGRGLWPFLAASLALNLVATAGWGLSLYFQEGNQHRGSMATAPVPTPVPVTAAPTAAGQRLHQESSSSLNFQWKQLESESYDTYIARLREIGCPEDTIKSIIAGELRAEAADRRAELERKILRSSDWSPPPGVSRQEYLAAQLRKLEREMDLTADNLLQSSAAPGSPGLASSRQQDNQPPVHYPAVLDDVTFQPGSSNDVRYVEPGVVEVPQEQLDSIYQIQQDFVQDIGGPNQDAEDPQYEQVWRTAQWKADQVFRTKYGWGAHSELQRAAAQKANDARRKAASSQ